MVPAVLHEAGGCSVYDRAILSQVLKPWAQQAVRPSHPRIFLCQAARVQLECVRETVPEHGVLQAAQSSLPSCLCLTAAFLCSCCRTPWSSTGSLKKPASSWQHASNKPHAWAELALATGSPCRVKPELPQEEQQPFHTVVTN